MLNTNLLALAPGQGVLRRIIGTVPAPTVNSNLTLGVGFGVYGQLQELVSTNAITLDQSLILFGNWPDLNGNAGPGGGVIRLDPDLTGTLFNPLTNVNVLGPSTVPEGTTTAYSGRARYANGYQIDFTNTTWTTTRFTITNGVLTTGIVTSNTPAMLDVKYSSGGFLYDTTTNIVILDLPPPRLSQIQVVNSNVTLTVQGVPNRKNVLEAANSLSPPIVWLPRSTNALDGNGLGAFTQATGTNRTRFFRARESD